MRMVPSAVTARPLPPEDLPAMPKGIRLGLHEGTLDCKALLSVFPDIIHSSVLPDTCNFPALAVWPVPHAAGGNSVLGHAYLTFRL